MKKGDLLLTEDAHALIVRRHERFFRNMRVLDAGSRDDVLRRAAPGVRQLVGVDLHHKTGGAEVVANVERALPFSACTFDTVVALEILEHTDRPARALGELLRVADQYAVVSLPNMYQIMYRLRVLLGRPVSGKYWLTSETASGRADRHRWFFTPDQVVAFIHREAAARGFEVQDQIWIVPRTSRWILGAIYRVAARLGRGHGWCAATMVFYLRRTAERTAA